jgi:hypothetical protein
MALRPKAPASGLTLPQSTTAAESAQTEDATRPDRTSAALYGTDYSRKGITGDGDVTDATILYCALKWND